MQNSLELIAQPQIKLFSDKWLKPHSGRTWSLLACLSQTKKICVACLLQQVPFHADLSDMMNMVTVHFFCKSLKGFGLKCLRTMNCSVMIQRSLVCILVWVHCQYKPMQCIHGSMLPCRRTVHAYGQCAWGDNETSTGLSWQQMFTL